MKKEFNKTSRTWEIELDSIDDLYNNQQLQPTGNANLHRSFKNFERNPVWTGASRSEIESRKYGWAEGSEKAKKMSTKFMPPKTDKFIKQWNDDDGDDGDYERFTQELPCLYKRKKKFASSAIKSGIMKIRINIGENCNVTSDEMLMKCATACRVVNQMERLGVRCEIWAESRQRGAVTDSNFGIVNLKTKTRIKRAEEPLNLSLVAHAFSSWFFRHHFTMFASANFNSTYGMGYSEMIEPSGKKDEIIINHGECKNEYSATAFIENLNRRIKNHFRD